MAKSSGFQDPMDVIRLLEEVGKECQVLAHSFEPADVWKVWQAMADSILSQAKTLEQHLKGDCFPEQHERYLDW